MSRKGLIQNSEHMGEKAATNALKWMEITSPNTMRAASHNQSTNPPFQMNWLMKKLQNDSD